MMKLIQVVTTYSTTNEQPNGEDKRFKDDQALQEHCTIHKARFEQREGLYRSVMDQQRKACDLATVPVWAFSG